MASHSQTPTQHHGTTQQFPVSTLPEQASSVQELSATIINISQGSEQTAAAARKAEEGIVATGEQVEEANGCVKILNEAMDSILTSSEEIAKIIAVIENISFQTTSLALPAPVHAARAGPAAFRARILFWN